MRRLAAVLVTAGVALILPGCATAATYAITISNMAFGLAPPGLKVGDTIEWINADIFEHSATARNASFDLNLPPKAHRRIVLKSAGKVAFYCRYHPGMTGVLVVSR